MPPINATFPTQVGTHYDVLSDFDAACNVLNRSILHFYMAPKNLVKKAGPILEKFVSAFPPKGKKADKKNLNTVVEFIEKLDDFTARTIELYEEHKMYNAESAAYLSKIKALSRKYKNDSALFTREYAQLAPEFVLLQHELDKITEKAVNVNGMLKEIEDKWTELSKSITI
ncbi:MAG: hypothetical protein U0T75_05940 [Chitinophagales bacterium]